MAGVTTLPFSPDRTALATMAPAASPPRRAPSSSRNTAREPSMSWATARSAPTETARDEKSARFSAEGSLSLDGSPSMSAPTTMASTPSLFSISGVVSAAAPPAQSAHTFRPAERTAPTSTQETTAST